MKNIENTELYIRKQGKRVNNPKKNNQNSIFHLNQNCPQASNNLDYYVENPQRINTYKTNVIPSLNRCRVIRIENPNNLCRNCRCHLAQSFIPTSENRCCDLVFTHSPIISIDENNPNSWKLYEHYSKLNHESTPNKWKLNPLKKTMTKDIGFSPSPTDLCQVDQCIQSTPENFPEQILNDNQVRVINITEKKNNQTLQQEDSFNEVPHLNKRKMKVILISQKDLS